MKTKSEIVNNWFPRYTGLRIEETGRYINTFANLKKWQFFHFFRSVTH